MEITTPRLILREFTQEDLPALLRYQADPRYSEFHGPEETGPDLAHKLIGMFLSWAAERPRQNYQLAIAQRDHPEEAIGSCGVRLRGCEAGRAEFGLELAPGHWGRGFAGEAARAILEFAFRDFGVEEVRGITITENARVQRLVERLGFTRVETRPGADWMSARGWSETVWGITAAEWSGE
ncbi:MAG TPA: GNAT family N-acetyltransferase [Thermoanaerobaculia bacterium]|nr:GNAT family N-acetyltransferase [Thermoanaerobaculia bacterium]